MLQRIQTLKPVLNRFFQTCSPSLQKMYVGNMTWTMNDESLRALFAKHGEVSDAFIVRDRLTGNLIFILREISWIRIRRNGQRGRS